MRPLAILLQMKGMFLFSKRFVCANLSHTHTHTVQLKYVFVVLLLRCEKWQMLIFFICTFKFTVRSFQIMLLSDLLIHTFKKVVTGNKVVMKSKEHFLRSLVRKPAYTFKNTTYDGDQQCLCSSCLFCHHIC